jgi:hypothetical protein
MARARVTIGDWPRLTRFYGLSPFELALIPNNILSIYAEQLPVLTAEEALLGFYTSDLPHLEKGTRRNLYRSFERMLPKPEAEKADLTTEEGKVKAGSFGIGVIIEEGSEVESSTES